MTLHTHCFARQGVRKFSDAHHVRSRLRAAAGHTTVVQAKAAEKTESSKSVENHKDLRQRLYQSEEGGENWPVMVGLSALVALICSVDRSAMSVAILPMSVEYLWDSSTKGLISSAFFLG